MLLVVSNSGLFLEVGGTSARLQPELEGQQALADVCLKQGGNRVEVPEGCPSTLTQTHQLQIASKVALWRAAHKHSRIKVGRGGS